MLGAMLGRYLFHALLISNYSSLSACEVWLKVLAGSCAASSPLVWCTEGKEDCPGEPGEGSEVPWGNWRGHRRTPSRAVHRGCSHTIFIYPATLQSRSCLYADSRTGSYSSSFCSHQYLLWWMLTQCFVLSYTWSLGPFFPSGLIVVYNFLQPSTDVL